MAAISRRQYKGAAASTTITSGINDTDAAPTVNIAATTGWPSTPGVSFFVVIDPGTSFEEKCLATISGTTLTLDRASTSRDDTSKSTHASGAVIYPVFTATEANEANLMASTMTTRGDLLTMGSGPTVARLGLGATSYALTSNGTDPVWAQITADGIATSAVTSDKILNETIVNLDISPGAAIAYSKLNLATSVVQGDVALTLLKALCPVGTIAATVQTTAPTGWILCNGTAVVSGTHPELYALCATTPDLRGRTVIGVGTGAGLTARALNATGGTETHALTTAELASHSHTIGGSTGGMSANETLSHSITDPGHSHEEVSSQVTSQTTAYTAGLNAFLNVGSTGVESGTDTTGISIASHTVSHTHTLPADTGSTGSGNAHNNMQPFYALNYIIKHDYV